MLLSLCRIPQHFFLWAFLFSELNYLKNHKEKTNVNILEIFKVVLNIIIISTSVYNWNIRILLNYVDTLSFVVALLILVCSICKGLEDSIFLTSFWTFQFLVTILTNANIKTITWAGALEISSTALIMLLNYLNMKNIEDENERSPEMKSNYLRRIYFQWFRHLNELGNHDELNENNIWKLNKDMECQYLLKKFRNHSAKDEYVQVPENEKVVEKLNFKTLLKPFWKKFLIAGVLRLALNLLFFVCPYLLRLILQEHVETSNVQNNFYVMMMFVVSIWIAFMNVQYFYHTYKIGLKIKSLLMTLIYEKSLKLKGEASEDVTLITIDANRFVELLPHLHMIWSGPITIIIATTALWYILGISAIAGVIVMIFTIVATTKITLKLKTLQIAQMNHKDNRLSLTNEIIGNIKHIKFYAWENFFENRVLSHRRNEIDILRHMIYFDALKYLVGIMAPFLVSITSFALFIIVNNENVLTLESAFVSIALFYILKYPLSIVSMLVTNLVAADNSINRINNFLNKDECQIMQQHSIQNFEDAVLIEKGFFAQNEKCVLHNINFKIEKNSFVAVVGMVGSGKTSLLCSLLGELKKLSGEIKVNGKIAYVPQETWILNQTILENITFGKKFDSENYDRIVAACALQDDIKLMKDGHRTLVGDKGITLSGGQKQRVCLARAIYNDADIYLLDDPLSSIDNHVADFIFEEVFSANGILSKKTRILVTQNIKHAERADKIFVMENGRILSSTNFQIDTKLKEIKQGKHVDSKDFQEKPIKFQNGEKVRKGRIASQTYLQYLSRIGAVSTATILLLSILNPIFDIFSTIWLAKWAAAVPSNGTYTKYNYLTFYTCFGLGQMVVLFLKSIFLTHCGLKVADALHRKLLKTTMHRKMEFFDKTPSGTILNRFSNDVEVVDNKIAIDTRDFVTTFFTVISILILFCIATKSLVFIIILLFIVVIYYNLLSYYLNTSRQLKRLEASTKSPIISQFNETRSGKTSIRAYNLQEKFFNDFVGKVDNHQRFSYFYIIAARWLGIRLELIGSVIIFFVTLLAIRNKDDIGYAYIGVVVSYALRLIPNLNQLIRITALVEIDVVSVERISEYLEEKEGKDDKKEEENKEWALKGKIEFINYSLKYETGNKTLKNLNITIEEGEKIGVIGRTGAGKSSLMTSLLKMYHEKEGSIEIDGINIDDLPTNQLRNSITIIPQNPVIFKGTIRMNIDPSNKFTDEKIWEILRECNLIDLIQKYPENIHKIMENDMSVGEKQLLCIARGLLKRSKIVILDEATSNIDLGTEKHIQSMIKEKFSNSTVFIVAHRVNTILDCDKILILENGEVKMFDTPEKLKEDKNFVSFFK